MKSARLRQLLVEHGVAVERAILADMFPDDSCFEFGVLVTHDRRVYQFGFDYLDTPIERASLAEWNEMTGNVAALVCCEQVNVALELLTEASG
jgi:hypothetical protein